MFKLIKYKGIEPDTNCKGKIQLALTVLTRRLTVLKLNRTAGFSWNTSLYLTQ